MIANLSSRRRRHLVIAGALLVLGAIAGVWLIPGWRPPPETPTAGARPDLPAPSRVDPGGSPAPFRGPGLAPLPADMVELSAVAVALPEAGGGPVAGRFLLFEVESDLDVPPLHEGQPVWRVPRPSEWAIEYGVEFRPDDRSRYGFAGAAVELRPDSPERVRVRVDVPAATAPAAPPADDRTRRFAVRVLDSATGQPVVGATVVLRDGQRQVADGVADDAGIFDWTGPPPFPRVRFGQVDAVVRHPAYAAPAGPVSLPPLTADQPPVDIVLESSARVSGVVVDADSGELVAGVQVYHLRDGQWQRPPGPDGGLPAGELQIAPVAPAGPLVFELVAPGYRSSVLAADGPDGPGDWQFAEPLTLQRNARSIRLRLLSPDGAPLAGQQVGLWLGRSDDDGRGRIAGINRPLRATPPAPTRRPYWNAETDANGRITIHEYSGDALTGRVMIAGTDPRPFTVITPWPDEPRQPGRQPGADQPEFVAHVGGELHLRLSAPDGTPLQDGRAWLHPADDQQPLDLRPVGNGWWTGRALGAGWIEYRGPDGRVAPLARVDRNPAALDAIVVGPLGEPQSVRLEPASDLLPLLPDQLRDRFRVTTHDDATDGGGGSAGAGAGAGVLRPSRIERGTLVVSGLSSGPQRLSIRHPLFEPHVVTVTPDRPPSDGPVTIRLRLRQPLLPLIRR